MEILRTDDARFEGLYEYPFEPHYVEVSDPDGGSVRMHYVDEGPRDGPPILMLHGSPDWSYSFRRLVTRFAGEGFRALAPDMIGFGRSDKPRDRRDHSIERHIGWLREFVRIRDLKDVTLVCQDWGGTMGPGVVVEEEERFARVLVANGIMHTAEAELAGRLPPGYSVHAINESEGLGQRLSTARAGRDRPSPCHARRGGTLPGRGPTDGVRRPHAGVHSQDLTASGVRARWGALTEGGVRFILISWISKRKSPGLTVETGRVASIW